MESLQRSRQATAEKVQAIVRQRDMYKALLAQMGASSIPEVSGGGAPSAEDSNGSSAALKVSFLSSRFDGVENLNPNIGTAKRIQLVQTRTAKRYSIVAGTARYSQKGRQQATIRKREADCTRRVFGRAIKATHN